MTEPRDGIVFVTYSGIEFALLGTHVVGAMRSLGCGMIGAAEYALLVTPRPMWHMASSPDRAKALLRRAVSDWYVSLHQPLVAGQGERLVREARVP